MSPARDKAGVDLVGPSQERSVSKQVVAQITRDNRKIPRPGANFAVGGGTLNQSNICFYCDEVLCRLG